MFGQETAVRGHQTDRPSVAPQDVDHGGNRVSYVIVQRTASKGKSTGLCELSFFAETQGLGADLYGRWETRIQVDVINVVWPNTRKREELLSGLGDSWGRMQISTVGDGIGVMRVGTSPREHPFVARHTSGFGSSG